MPALLLTATPPVQMTPLLWVKVAALERITTSQPVRRTGVLAITFMVLLGAMQLLPRTTVPVSPRNVCAEDSAWNGSKEQIPVITLAVASNILLGAMQALTSQCQSPTQTICVERYLWNGSIWVHNIRVEQNLFCFDNLEFSSMHV